MSQRLVFQELLDRLRSERDVGVDDYETLERFLGRTQGASMTDLRIALAALFGRDAAGRERVLEIFDDLYGDSRTPLLPRPKPPGEAAPTAARTTAGSTTTSVDGARSDGIGSKKSASERSAGGAWTRTRALARRLAAASYVGRAATILVFVALTSATAFVVWKQYFQPPPVVPKDEQAQPQDAPTAADANDPDWPAVPPVYASMPDCATWTSPRIETVPIVVAGVVLLLGMATVSIRRYFANRQRARADFPRDAWAAAVQRGVPEPDRLPPSWFSPGDLRSALQRGERMRLDVPRTAFETARRGLVPTLRYARRMGTARVVVLQDVGANAEAFQPRFDSFVEGLLRQGVEVDRWFFDEDLSRVSAGRHAATHDLATAPIQSHGSALIMLSTGDTAPTRSDVSRWLAPWPRRVLLTPIRDRARLAPIFVGEDRLMTVFHLDAQGIGDAARALQEDRAPARESRGRRVLPSEVLRLRALLALAPTPSFALAEQLRERFMPTSPSDVLRAVRTIVREGTGSPDAVEALSWLRSTDASADGAARVFIAEQLDLARPRLALNETGESLAELRRRRDRALLELQAADPTTQERGLAEISRLARTPLRGEMLAMIEQAPAKIESGKAGTHRALTSREAMDEVRTSLSATSGDGIDAEVVVTVERDASTAPSAVPWDKVAEAIASQPDPAYSAFGLRARARWMVPTLSSFVGLILLATLAMWGSIRGLEWRAAPMPLDGTRRMYSDVELVRGLCQFDSIGAAYQDTDYGLYFVATAPPAVAEPGRFPPRRVVLVHLEPVLAGWRATATTLGSESIAGPEHTLVGFFDASAEGTRIRGEEGSEGNPNSGVRAMEGARVPAGPAGIVALYVAAERRVRAFRFDARLAERSSSDAAPASAQASFPAFPLQDGSQLTFYDERSQRFRPEGRVDAGGNWAWAQRERERQINTLSQGLLPGSTGDFVNRLLGLEPPKDLPEPLPPELAASAIAPPAPTPQPPATESGPLAQPAPDSGRPERQPPRAPDDGAPGRPDQQGPPPTTSTGAEPSAGTAATTPSELSPPYEFVVETRLESKISPPDAEQIVRSALRFPPSKGAPGTDPGLPPRRLRVLARVLPPRYENGNLTQELAIDVYELPSNSLKDTFRPTMTKEGTRTKDVASERTLLEMCALSAARSVVAALPFPE